jgi:hypothetical protein
MSAATMTETEWQTQLIDLAHTLGWRHLHVRRSIGKRRGWVTTTNVIGWPDLLLWSPRQPGRHIAAELKSATGKLTPEQEQVLADLAAAGFETYVWRPDDLDEALYTLRPPKERR